jgi:very-short-patch-repair endonuclease
MKQKIINEWEKIKNFNIFNNIDEFSKLFEINPNGLCFRKYTNYPWCKENFFFGTYNELLTFYKTSKEIPFYLSQYIDKKYNQLTIKSFDLEFTNGKRKYFANCICDCGKECRKEFNKIVEGHVTTCGNHKKTRNTDLLSNYPEIVSQYWDYDKNAELPENIKITSENKYWWKDETGSFLLKPIELTKRRFGTSFHEQCIYFYCNRIFNNVKNRFRLRIHKISTEIDIFLPDINVAIEYDGVYWHKSKENIDLEKTKRLNDENIFLIRVREKGLSLIQNELTKTIICEYDDNNFYKIINEIIAIIKEYIKSQNIAITLEENKKILEFNLTDTEFDDNKLTILNQYRTNYVSDNITKTCLIKYWDYEKNKDIIPQKISIYDDIKVWFTCKYGFSRKINVKSLSVEHSIDCKNLNKKCLNCNGLYCPFYQHCGRFYYRSNPCKQIIKYFYFRIFYEKEQNIDKIIYFNNEDYFKYSFSEIPENHSDDFYELHNIYKYHKKELETNSNLFATMRKIFTHDDMSMKNFNNFEEFQEYINFYNPYIEKICFKDFDNDTEIRKKFLKFLLEYISSHFYNIELLKLSDDDKGISYELSIGLVKILKKLCHYNKTKDYLRIIPSYDFMK